MDDILFIGTFVLIIIFAASIGIWIAKNTKKQREEMKNETPKVIDLDEPPTEPIVRTVKVIDQSCCAKVVGTKRPKAVEQFIITFEEPDGNTFDLAVPHECYDGFEIGQIGKLSTVNGELYGFELEEKR